MKPYHTVPWVAGDNAGISPQVNLLEVVAPGPRVHTGMWLLLYLNNQGCSGRDCFESTFNSEIFQK